MGKTITKVLSIFMLVLSLSVSAQKKIPSFLEFQTDINTQGFNPAIGFKFGLYKEVESNIRIGGGLGIMESTSFDGGPCFPIFGRAEFDISKKGPVVPTLALDLGYEFNTNGIEFGDMFFNPALNLRFNNKYYFGVGYRGGIMFTEGANWQNDVALRFGLFFSTTNSMKKIGNGLSRFFKRTRFGLEAIGGFGVGSASELLPQGNVTYSNFMRGVAGFHWLYEINEHWATGIGAHVGIYSFKKKTDPIGYYYGDEEERQSDVDVALFWRTEYTYKEIAKNLKPYADVDLGVGASLGFIFSPQVGIKFKDRYRFGFAPTVGTQMWNMGPGGTGVSMELHAGIDF